MCRTCACGHVLVDAPANVLTHPGLIHDFQDMDLSSPLQNLLRTVIQLVLCSHTVPMSSGV